MSDSGKRFYRSFINQMVNDLDPLAGHSIVEIKVVEHGQQILDLQFILRDSRFEARVSAEALKLLRVRLSNPMEYEIRFTDFIDHDYRRTFRVIERIGELEFAGGMVSDDRKYSAISEVQTRFTRIIHNPKRARGTC